MRSAEGHFSENDPSLRVYSAAEQMSFLIHSVGGDVVFWSVCEIPSIFAISSLGRILVLYAI